MSSDSRFSTPLTSMFKRSSSAPASHARVGAEEPAVPDNVLAARRHSVCSVPLGNVSRDTSASRRHFDHEARARASRDINAAGNEVATRENTHRLSPLQPALLAFTSAFEADGLAIRPPWADVSDFYPMSRRIYSN